MQNKGSDAAKAAVLLILIVGVLSFTFSHYMSSRSVPVDQTVQVATPDLKSNQGSQKVADIPRVSGTQNAEGTGQTAAGSAEAPGSIAPRSDNVNEPIPASPRDPFKPPPGVRIATNSPGGSETQGSPNKSRGQALPFVRSGDSSFKGEIQPAPIEKPQIPIELKGLITGDPAIAVMMVDGQISYKQQGDLVDGGMTVARITEAGVILKQGDRNYIIAVGHTLKPMQTTALAEETLVPRKLPADRVQKAESIEGPYDELLALRSEAKQAVRQQSRVASLTGWWKYGNAEPAPSVKTGHAKPTSGITTPARVRPFRAVAHRKLRRKKHRRTIHRKHRVKHSITAANGTRRHKHRRHRRHRHIHHAVAPASLNNSHETSASNSAAHHVNAKDFRQQTGFRAY